MNKPVYKLLDLIDTNKLNWQKLSSNPYAIELIEANPDKIYWDYLSCNRNAIELLEANQDKIDWKLFSENSSIFTLDYTQMRINFQDLEEEIIKEVMKPRRIFRNLELYGYDIDDMFD